MMYYHTFVNLIKNSTIFGKVLIHFPSDSFITHTVRKREHLHLRDILSCLDILFNYYFLTFFNTIF